MNTLLRRILAGASLVAASIAAAPAAFAGWYQLYLPTVTQEHSNWCWAGTSKAILDYYGKPASQCSIVNWAYGLNYACNTAPFSWNDRANTANAMYGTGGSIQNILRAFGNLSTTAYDYASSWNSVVADINGWRPFVIRYGWTSGGGHFIVGYGWQQYDGVNYVDVMDPWPGEGKKVNTYAYTVASTSHRWTHTLRINP